MSTLHKKIFSDRYESISELDQYLCSKCGYLGYEVYLGNERKALCATCVENESVVSITHVCE